MNHRIYVMLGRAGDVINFLPVLQVYKDQTGDVPELLVSEPFAEILDGVSYAKALPWKGGWQYPIEAIEWARHERPGAEIVNCAVYGIGFRFSRRCASFDREAWTNADCPFPWGDVRPLFDRRNREREMQQLWNPFHLPMGTVVTCFSGVSTPFPDHSSHEINELLRAAGFNVVDVSNLRAPRIYDLLGLLERAFCLVCSDTSILHLAAAVPTLPVVSLVQDRVERWQRSSWRAEHVDRVFYSDAVLNPGRIVESVRRCRDYTARRKFYRVFSYVGTPEESDVRRLRVAHASWQFEMLRGRRMAEARIPGASLPRSTATVYGENKPAPYYRDLIEPLIPQMRMQDVLIICNADVGVTPGFTGWVIEALERHGAVFTHRWDYDLPIEKPLKSEAQVCDGAWYPGSDCWAFTKAWWLSWGDRFPDMAMGREAGDMIFRNLIKLGGGVEIPAAIWHEKHPSFWEHWGNRETLPSNVRNRILATDWLKENGGIWNDGKEVRP